MIILVYLWIQRLCKVLLRFAAHNESSTPLIKTYHLEGGFSGFSQLSPVFKTNTFIQ